MLSKTLFLLSSLIYFALPVNAQLMYYCDPDGNIHSFEISTCTNNKLFSATADSIVFLDLTFAADNQLYGISNKKKLYRIDLANQQLDQMPNCCETISNFGFNSLTSDAHGNIYGAGKEVFIYNLQTQDYKSLGPIPSFMLPAGDLTFANGQLYFGALGSKIVQLNIDDPSASSVWFNTEDYTPFYGLGNNFSSCSSYQIYGTSQSGQIAKLDFLTKNVEAVNCPNFGNAPLGIAFPNEYQASECDPILFDLDKDNSSGLYDLNFQSYLCPQQPGNIVDTDLLFETTEIIDSITVQFVETPPDGQHEFLLVSPTNQLIFEGNGKQKLTILPQLPSSSLSDFKNALFSTYYHNSSPDPTLNIARKIEVKVWLNNDQQLLAYSFITIKWPYAGQDVDTVICNPNAVIDIKTLVDVAADKNGYFVAMEPIDTNNQLPIITTTGEFLYIVTFENCYSDTSTINVTYDNGYFTFGPDLNIYDESIDTILLEIDVPTSSIIWQDSSSESFYKVTKSGYYWANIISENGCAYSDNIRIRFWDTLRYNRNLFFCQGEIFELDGEVFMEDTSFCYVLSNSNWYVYKFCYDLHFQPNYERLDTTICQGDTLYFMDSIYTEAGNYNHFLKSECRGLIDLNLSFWPPDTSYLYVQFEDGNTFEMNGITLSSSGEHEILLQNEKGCDSTVFVNVAISPLNIYAPNAFSPNFDGINDKFNLYAGPPVQSINYLKIFDRWGSLVFHEEDFPPNNSNAGWDGKTDGIPATRGTYIWLAEVLLKNGEKKFIKGEVLLMK